MFHLAGMTVTSKMVATLHGFNFVLSEWADLAVFDSANLAGLTRLG